MSVSIVTVLTDPATAARALDAAACAAAISPEATIEAFHPRPAPESFILLGEELLTERREAELKAMLDQRSAAMQQVVRDWITAAPGRSVAWNEAEGEGVEALVAARGKTAALIVLARPEAEDGKAALHAAIFDTGRLLLLVPPAAVPAFGEHMAIAWKASDQATRAVTAAISWLKHAAKVSVLTAVKPDGPPRDPEGAVALLEDQGITPEARVLTRGGASVAELLLREAHAIGADCLVMGAYRHSELRELILGGVTRHMLHAADLPLFMVH
jgi:nucleotide-binding universal stress UspA family protein